MTQPSLFTDTPARPRRRADAGPRYTPVELARLLRLHAPTPEQAAIIAAPVEPVLVVAGAGSGKTETMASRGVITSATLVAPNPSAPVSRSWATRNCSAWRSG